MTLAEALKELEACGTEQNRKTYRRYGAGENLYGVSFANLYAFQKRIKTDHALALALWKTGNGDARNLATLIADPAQLTDKVAEAWAGDATRFLTFQLAKLVSASPLARDKAEAWRASSDERLACLGWTVIAALAMNGAETDGYFTKLLGVIQRDLQRSPNWARYAMNNALCAIGLRNDTLQAPAIAVAGKIGKVEVDMGETPNCQVPDAAAYIRKGAARRKAKGKTKK
jgi:3-methyladenine DNA glycosylase AlkD